MYSLAPEEINRRVALALGWQWVATPERDCYSFNAPNAFSKGFFEKRGLIYVAVSEVPDEWLPDYGNAPNYCTDPAAADLIIQSLIEEKARVETHSDFYCGDWVNSVKISPHENTDPPVRQWANAYCSEGTPMRMVMAMAFLLYRNPQWGVYQLRACEFAEFIKSGKIPDHQLR